VSRLETLLRSEKELIREECIDALTAIGSEAAQRALLRLTDHENEYIRRKAAASLTRMKPVHLVPELTAAMSHADERVAALASSALATLPLNLVLPILVDAFRHQPKMRPEILAALEPRNDKSLNRLFLAGLRDRSKHARMHAARWFARRGDDDSDAALIAAARRGDGAVASVVWRFLLAAGETGTEAGLEKALAEVDGSDLMAASFIHSGNRTLAGAARRPSSWQPKTFPRIKWGSGRGK
jgi:HEAT repeat protein